MFGPTLPTLIWGKAPVRTTPRPPNAAGFTSISHVVYINSCLPNGCDLTAGDDDARLRQSSMAQGHAHISPWSYGDAQWQELVQCVKDTYSPFDITVVTEDPGMAPHSEIIVAGTPEQLNPQISGAGGIAPFLGCGATEDNTISFMFAGLTNSLNYLCGGAAQETSHVFGLDHELDAKDPMTYLDLVSRKTFQNADVQCGEDFTPDDHNSRTSGTHMCSEQYSNSCHKQTQNSFGYLMANFGPTTRPPGTITFTKPQDGAWVKPGFPIHVTINSYVSVVGANLAIDGGAPSPTTTGPFVFNAPATISAGDHTVAVNATDVADTAITGSISVHVTAACGADGSCASNTHCLTGFCLPGADVAGGLGATCTQNDECITNSCASDGTTMLCSGSCDADNVCPSGYDCLETGTSGICWPAASGGCSVGGGRGSFVMLVGLAMAAALRRRRR